MSFLPALAIERRDPLEIHAALPFSGTYYPLGFRLQIATNSRHVLEAAAEAWGHWLPEFACDAIEFRILVRPEGEPCGEPSHRAHAHLYSVVSDRHNFAMFDLRALRGAIYVSEATAADRSRLRWFYVESAVYTLLAQRYAVPLHAACVARDDSGILLCGPSGAGKSTLAFGCARAGWTYISDDGVFLVPGTAGRVVIGRHLEASFRVDAPSLFPELGKYIARVRPNGKVGIEVPMSAFPRISTATRATVEALVFLERGGVPCLHPMSSDEAAARLIGDLPSYGDEVNAIHERAIRNIAEAPAFLLRYESVDDAVHALDKVMQASRPVRGLGISCMR